MQRGADDCVVSLDEPERELRVDVRLLSDDAEQAEDQVVARLVREQQPAGAVEELGGISDALDVHRSILVASRQCISKNTPPRRPPARSASRRHASPLGPCGKDRVERDSANRRVVEAAEVERLRAPRAREALGPQPVSRRRPVGEVEGLLARVEIDVTEPTHVVAIITRESVEQLGLRPGISAAGVVKATSVMVER